MLPLSDLLRKRQKVSHDLAFKIRESLLVREDILKLLQFKGEKQFELHALHLMLKKYHNSIESNKSMQLRITGFIQTLQEDPIFVKVRSLQERRKALDRLIKCRFLSAKLLSLPFQFDRSYALCT